MEIAIGPESIHKIGGMTVLADALKNLFTSVLSINMSKSVFYFET